MVRSLLQRSILLDVVKTSMLTIVAMTAVLLMIGALAEVYENGLDWGLVLRLLPYLLPSTVPYTIATGMLMACSVVYGRLAASNELTAIKAGGINVMSVVQPVLILGFASAAVSLYLSAEIIPFCNRRCNRIIREDLRKNLADHLAKKSSLNVGDIELFVERVEGDHLYNVVAKVRDESDDYAAVIEAQYGTIKLLPQESGEDLVRIHLTQGVARIRSRRTVFFENHDLEMKLPDSLGLSPGKHKGLLGQLACSRSTLSLSDCLTIAATARAKVRQLRLEMHGADAPPDPVDIESVRGQPKEDLSEIERESREAHVAMGRFHLRFVRSIASAPFVLLACPLGVLYGRRDYLQSFFRTFLPTVAVYYPTVILLYNVVKKGDASPQIVWFPPLVLSLFAALALRRIVRF